ncbi:hypothetical protein [Paraliobacillus sp. X-1268]|uniref:hypothetical protein n=1 Tax=Paraliobacillus sp. X-1268 TaxID=2213193 RepID=UPI000E3BD76C|nr:hypothetical protein [Paraliobacillus sp. X-1268]
MNPLKKEGLDLAEFEASNCIDTIRPGTSGGLNVVYSKNGKRLSLNAAILTQLSNQSTVQIAYSENHIAIANYIGDKNTNYTLKQQGKNGAIYNAALVKEIIERYQLDFSNRTSLTFPVFEVQDKDDEMIVYINMRPVATQGD